MGLGSANNLRAAVEAQQRAGIPGKSEHEICARGIPLGAGVPAHFFLSLS